MERFISRNHGSCQNQREVQDMLSRAGFSGIEFRGRFEGSSFSEKSERMVAKAIKGSSCL